MSLEASKSMRPERPTTQSCSESSSKAQKRRCSGKRHFLFEGTWFLAFAKVRQTDPYLDLNFRDIQIISFLNYSVSETRWQFWFWKLIARIRSVAAWLQGSALKGRGRGRGRPVKGKVGRPQGTRGLKRPAAVTCLWSWNSGMMKNMNKDYLE